MEGWGVQIHHPILFTLEQIFTFANSLVLISHFHTTYIRPQWCASSQLAHLSSRFTQAQRNTTCKNWWLRNMSSTHLVHPVTNAWRSCSPIQMAFTKKQCIHSWDGTSNTCEANLGSITPTLTLLRGTRVTMVTARLNEGTFLEKLQVASNVTIAMLIVCHRPMVWQCHGYPTGHPSDGLENGLRCLDRCRSQFWRYFHVRPQNHFLESQKSNHMHKVTLRILSSKNVWWFVRHRTGDGPTNCRETEEREKFPFLASRKRRDTWANR